MPDASSRSVRGAAGPGILSVLASPTRGPVDIHRGLRSLFAAVYQRQLLRALCDAALAGEDLARPGRSRLSAVLLARARRLNPATQWLPLPARDVALNSWPEGVPEAGRKLRSIACIA